MLRPSEQIIDNAFRRTDPAVLVAYAIGTDGPTVAKLTFASTTQLTHMRVVTVEAVDLEDTYYCPCSLSYSSCACSCQRIAVPCSCASTPVFSAICVMIFPNVLISSGVRSIF
jgi:hypothetical protein